MSTTPTVLIADDDQALVAALKIRLEKEGYEILTATDSYAALAQTVAKKPDLLVLDIHMPAGSGFTVQERKVRMGELADVPVIYITGDRTPETTAMAEACNAVGVLHKPFEIDTLLDLVARVLPCQAA